MTVGRGREREIARIEGVLEKELLGRNEWRSALGRGEIKGNFVGERGLAFGASK